MIVVIASGFALAGISGIARTDRLLSAEMETRGKALLTAMTPPCAVALAAGDDEALDRYVLQVIRGDRAAELELEHVMVLDHDGRVRSHSDPSRFGTRLEHAFYRSAIAADGPRQRYLQASEGQDATHLEVSAPIVNGLRWGTLVAQFSLERVEAAVVEEGGWVAATAAMLALFCWLALSLVLTFNVLRRTERLAEAAEALGRGDLERRVPTRGRDELSRLGASFNHMADALQSHTIHLEDKVAARSRALAEEKTKLENTNAELRRAVDQLELLALTDGLTGLANHRRFQEALALELRRCARAVRPMSLIMIDVDHFKVFNDCHGHPSGDAVLQQLSNVFRSTLRHVDIVARYGGEEFGVLLLDTDLDGAALAAEKIRRAVEEEDFPGEVSQPGGRLTISLGVAAHPDHGLSPSSIIRAADAALYAAKAAGRNQVFVAPEPEAPAGGPHAPGAEDTPTEGAGSPGPEWSPPALIVQTQEIPRGQ